MDSIPSQLPVLPIRNAVLFPSISMPLVVGRGKSIKALEKAEANDNLIVVVAQRVMTQSDPLPEELFKIGTLCRIENVTYTETGGRQVVVTGIVRFNVLDFSEDPKGFLSCRGEVVADIQGTDPVRNEALFFNLKQISREILELLPG